jgi:hypothetical protein
VSEALAAFIAWCAPQLDELRAELRELAQQWRARSLAHRRTADALGGLAVAHALWRRFTAELGAIDARDAKASGRRVGWFRRGLETGSLESYDTFAASAR